jgi:hypothetical protein
VRTDERTGGGTVPEKHLGDALAELSSLLPVEVDDVDDFLQGLVDRSAELLGVLECAILLGDDAHRLHLVASRRRSELPELPYAAGPAGHCRRTGEVLCDEDLSVPRTRWPEFARVAVAAGTPWTSVLPLRAGGQVVGVLSLLSDRGGTTPDARALARGVADLATIALCGRSGTTGTSIVGLLDSFLSERVVVEQAVGVLAARAGIDVPSARARLRTHARLTGTALPSVAGAVVSCSLRSTVTEDDARLLRRLSDGSPATSVAAELQVDVRELGRRLHSIRTVLGVGSTVAAERLLRPQGSA